MKIERFDIYLVGVGGQGIGLLSEVMVRAADYAGHIIRGVDTHGLAQRGGTVVSNLRLGQDAHSPLIRRGRADLVVALELHEALRGATEFLKPGGTLVYYDAVWQPLAVRLQKEAATTPGDLEELAAQRHFHVIRVFLKNLADARMQNVAVMATLAREKLVPGLDPEHFQQALNDLLRGPVLKANLELFQSILSH